MMKDRFCA